MKQIYHLPVFRPLFPNDWIAHCQRAVARILALSLGVMAAGLLPLPLAHATPPPVGGGILDVGLTGEYYANNSLSGAPAFTRKDLRINFDWRDVLPVGGSTMPGMAGFPTDNYSIRWTGQVVARFTETYTFKVVSDEGARLYIRPEGAGSWTTLVDNWTAHTQTTNSATYAMTAGTRYDVKLEYWEGTGNAIIALRWASPNTPEELLDVVSTSSVNTAPYDGTMFADVASVPQGWSAKGFDAQGWLTSDGSITTHYKVYGGSFPGRWLLQFNGKAQVKASVKTLVFDVAGQKYTNTVPVGVGYDAGSNLTTLPFDTTTSVQTIAFTNTQRTASSPTNSGLTNVRLMMPLYGGATNYTPVGTMINAPSKDAFTQYVATRYQGDNLNWATVNWADRTLPSYAGLVQKSPIQSGYCLEKLIMAANEMGRDLYFIYGTQINQDFMTNIARLVQFGSDGVNPYTNYVANPVYPPLNPNLRVYLEHGNEEGWSAVQGEPPNWPAIMASDDGPIINYDGQYPNGTTTTSTYGAFYRWHALRSWQMGRACRAVVGEAAMNDRCRVLLFGQYTANYLNTMGQFLDNYFNNGDGINHVADPHPPSYNIWGGGGATYYWTGNYYGISPTTSYADNGFEDPDVPTGALALRPTGTAWTFTGNAGICDVRLPRSAVVSNEVLGALASNTAGSNLWLGCKFTVGAKDLWVYEVGRWQQPGGSAHTVRIYDTSGNLVAGGAGTNFPSGNYLNQPIRWMVTIPRYSPARLTAGKSYYLLSQESAGSTEPYYDETTTVTPRAELTVDAAIEYSGTGTGFITRAGANHTFGPVNMVCATAALETPEGYVGAPPDETYDPARITSRLSYQCAFLGGTGAISQVVNFPSTGIYYCVFEAAKMRNGNNNFSIYFDDTLVVSNKSMGGYEKHADTMFEYSSVPFTNSTAGPHTIRFQGLGATNQCVFFDWMYIGDREEFFGGPGATNFPSGQGGAMSESQGETFKQRVTIESNMARTWGWVPTTYEGGMGIGGDTLNAGMDSFAYFRSWDPYSIQADHNAQDLWTWAGGHIITYYYEQWYNNNFYSINPTNYMLVKAVMDYNRQWTMEPGNGFTAPAVLTPTDAHYSGGPYSYSKTSLAATLPASGWMSWNVITPATATYRVTASSTAGGQLQVVVNDNLPLGTGPSGSDVTGTVFLTKGQHTVKVKAIAGTFDILQVAVQQDGSPTSAPPNVSATDNGTNAVVNWSTIPGATGYAVRYGTSRDSITNELDAGTATSLILSNLANGRYYFHVYGYNGAGLGLPSVERTAQVLAPGAEGVLAGWDFAGNAGDEDTVPPTGYVQWFGRASAVKRGSGYLRVAKTDAYSYSDSASPWRVSTNLADAVSLNRYIEFTVTPAVSRELTVSAVQFLPFWSSFGAVTPGAGLAYSTDGTTFTSPIPATGTPATTPAGNTSTFNVDLTGETALQKTTNVVTFRIYSYGAQLTSTTCGLGGVGDDLMVLGNYTVSSANQPPTIATPATATPALIGATNTTLSILATDDGGEPSLTYTWTVVAKPSGATDPSFSTNGINAAKNVTALFRRNGGYTFRATATDAGELSAFSEVSVFVTQSLATAVSLPLGARVMNGGRERYGVTGYDQFGARMSPQPAWTWSVAGVGGTIDPVTAQYAAPASGSGTDTVKAVAGTLTNTVLVTVPAADLTPLMARGDVGNPSTAGSATLSNGVFTLIGYGNALSSQTTDQFHFVRARLTGDGEVVAKVRSLSRTTARAGVMIRETLGPDAKYLLMAVDPANWAVAQTNTLTTYYRSSDGASGLSATGKLPTAAPWIKVTRVGNVLTGYGSTDGTTWQQISSARTITMSDPVELGLAMSANGSTVCTTQFEQVSISTNALVSVAATVASTSEGSPAPAVFTVSRTGATDSDLTVNYALTGTATNNVDYATLPGSVTISNGNVYATVNLLALLDGLPEPTETVSLNLLPDPGYALGLATNATVSILDVDTLPVVTVVASVPDTTEGTGAPGVFTFTRSGPTNAALMVNYTLGGTASNGVDCTALSGTVNVPAGATTATVNVIALDDGIVEPTETLVLTLASGTGYNIGTPSSDTVNILDNSPAVSVAATVASTYEGSASPGVFTFTRTGPTNRSISVNYTLNGTASNGVDYTTLPGTVTMAVGSFTATVNVSAISDGIVEPTETVALTLADGTGYTVDVPDTATVTIDDPPPLPTVTVMTAVTNTVEGSASPAKFMFSRTGATNATLTVYYALSGTASNGLDYTTLPGSVTIAVNSNNAVVNVTALTDAVLEGTESVIATVASNAAYQVGVPNSATAYILDNQVDYFTEQFTGTAPNTNDLAYKSIVFTPTGSSNYTACLSPATVLPDLTNGLSIAASLGDDGSLNTVLTSSKAVYIYGIRYTNFWVNANGNITFGSGDRTANETLNQHFSQPRIAALFDDLNPGSRGTVTRTQLTDRVVLSFLNVPEYQTTNTNTFQITQYFDGRIVVSWLKLDSKDNIVGLSKGGGQPAGFIQTDLSTYGSCLPTLTVAAIDAIAAEWGTAGSSTFTITRTGGTNGNLNVNYALTGTAINGTDYSTLTSPVSLPSNNTTAKLTVLPIADGLAEGDESVLLTLQTGTGYYLGAPTNATITIQDAPWDAWRLAQFGGNANNSAVAGDTADPDRDGKPNLLEYAHGTNPNSAISVSAPAVGTDGSHLTLTYQRRKNLTDVTCIVEGGNSLTLTNSWSAAIITEQILADDGTNQTIKATDSVPIGSTTQRFLRLRVTRP